MTTVNIFERASREDLRFDSPRGELTVSQLWQLPLTSTVANKPNLNSIAQTVIAELKSLSEESFVNVTPDPRRNVLSLKLDVLKHIRDVRLAENAAAAAAAADAEQLAYLRDLKANKQRESLQSLSLEEIDSKIAALAGKTS